MRSAKLVSRDMRHFPVLVSGHVDRSLIFAAAASRGKTEIYHFIERAGNVRTVIYEGGLQLPDREAPRSSL